MGNVNKVRIVEVVPGFGHEDNYSNPPQQGFANSSLRGFFGHTLSVEISADKLENCRLYWAEKTNMPIVDRQSSQYFIDMCKLYPQGKTFGDWKQRSGKQDLTLHDTPAIRAKGDNAVYRWLDIVVIVHDPVSNKARKAHFSQGLLFFPGGDCKKALEYLHKNKIPVPSSPNCFVQSGEGERNYIHEIVCDDVELSNPVQDIADLFKGAGDQLWK